MKEKYTSTKSVYYILGSKCHFYRANVAPYFDPNFIEIEGPPKETAPGKCYTLWLFENDITPVFNETFATTKGIPFNGIAESGTLRIFNEIDGYSCDISGRHYYHSSGLETPTYYELRSPVNVKVSKIIVKPRTAYDSHFDSIEARIGNVPRIANFDLNTKFGNTMDYSPTEEYIIYDGSSNPLTGTVVILKRLDYSIKPYLVIEELKIIGEIA